MHPSQPPSAGGMALPLHMAGAPPYPPHHHPHHQRHGSSGAPPSSSLPPPHPPPPPNHHHPHQHQRPPPPLLGKTVQVGAHLVRVERHLSSGGYADVYRCTDGATGHPFALKHLRLDGDASHIAGAQREAKAMARLRGHPCVLRLHAVAFAGPRGGETDGFFLLDLCPGTLIEAMHAAGFRLPEPAVVEAFSCVAHAVAHMHAQQPLPLAHRDLKAENVLRLQDGVWVLCDFGSATTKAASYGPGSSAPKHERDAEEEAIRRHTTPAYRAPEMWDLSTGKEIGAKADVWALGVLLYVLAFGRLPFQGEGMRRAALEGRYVDAPPDAPPRHPLLRRMVAEMLCVDPDRRPSAAGVLTRLRELQAAIAWRPSTPAVAAALEAAARLLLPVPPSSSSGGGAGSGGGAPSSGAGAGSAATAAPNGTGGGAGGGSGGGGTGGGGGASAGWALFGAPGLVAPPMRPPAAVAAATAVPVAVAAAVRPHHHHHTAPVVPSAAPAAAAAAAAAPVAAAAHRPAAAPAAASVPPPPSLGGGSSGAGAGGEVDALRRDVRLLADEREALVSRVRQLEEASAAQRAALSSLGAQVASLTRALEQVRLSQRAAALGVGGGGGGGGGSSGGGGGGAGGSYGGSKLGGPGDLGSGGGGGGSPAAARAAASAAAGGGGGGGALSSVLQADGRASLLTTVKTAVKGPLLAVRSHAISGAGSPPVNGGLAAAPSVDVGGAAL